MSINHPEMKKCLLYLLPIVARLFFINPAVAQDSLLVEKATTKWQVSGYVTDMQVVSFKKVDSMTATNLIHNRMDIRFTPNKNLSFHAGIRNRVFFADPASDLPGFGDQVNAYYQNDLLRLSKFWINQNSLVVTSVIDRLWADWIKGNWEIRVGKQRVNWGKTLVWNPNDWFNSFNYADFDYPERPGNDAVRISYFPTGMSTLEIATSGRHRGTSVTALRYGFNHWNYDFQILGGLYHQQLALGTGWSGNISNVGFRGEASWFHPYRHFRDSSGRLSATISFDYRAPNTWYVQAAVLYNTIEHQSADLEELIRHFTGSLSAEQLMPSEWSFFEETSRDITPLWHADLSIISGLHPALIFLMPGVSYSLTENMQLSGTGQIFIGKKDNHMEDVGNGIYLRFKYNF
jgi:hypothetical protein